MAVNAMALEEAPGAARQRAQEPILRRGQTHAATGDLARPPGQHRGQEPHQQQRRRGEQGIGVGKADQHRGGHRQQRREPHGASVDFQRTAGNHHRLRIEQTTLRHMPAPHATHHGMGIDQRRVRQEGRPQGAARQRHAGATRPAIEVLAPWRVERPVAQRHQHADQRRHEHDSQHRCGPEHGRGQQAPTQDQQRERGRRDQAGAQRVEQRPACMRVFEAIGATAEAMCRLPGRAHGAVSAQHVFTIVRSAQRVHTHVRHAPGAQAVPLHGAGPGAAVVG